jgi:ubiquinone/menaquinone biosynthesis C-methylase UbiE
MRLAEAISAYNERTFARRDLAEELATWDWIEAGEERLLRSVERKIEGAGILEIGVGAGRMVERLRKISRRYTAIDYSQAMIDTCRARHPDIELRKGDVRQLSRFGDGEFALVVFGMNGLDYVAHEQRLLALREIRRVLRPGAYFLFSSHNLNSELFSMRRGETLVWDAKRNWAIVRDDTKRFSYLCYYARRGEVLEQLRAAGFRGPVEACSREGRDAGEDSRSYWLHYLACK